MAKRGETAKTRQITLKFSESDDLLLYEVLAYKAKEDRRPIELYTLITLLGVFEDEIQKLQPQPATSVAAKED